MQDWAPGHTGIETTVLLFHLILTRYDRMESNERLLRGNYPDYHKSYDKLKNAVKEAWDVIGPEVPLGLVREMAARCQAVVNAKGLQSYHNEICM